MNWCHSKTRGEVGPKCSRHDAIPGMLSVQELSKSGVRCDPLIFDPNNYMASICCSVWNYHGDDQSGISPPMLLSG